MKRHNSLIPLTHDHHHALAQVRTLLLSAGQSNEERKRKANDFVVFFETETRTHFREEEEVVFPPVVDEAEAEPILARVMLQHLHIHALVHTLRSELEGGTPSAGALSSVANKIEEHIRFEEKTVFPLIERLLPEEVLNAVALHPRHRSQLSKCNGQE